MAGHDRLGDPSRNVFAEYLAQLAICVFELGGSFPDLRFQDLGVRADLPVESGVLQRDRGLRREHFQSLDSCRGECTARQIVFEVEQPHQIALVDEWRAQHG